MRTVVLFATTLFGLCVTDAQSVDFKTAVRRMEMVSKVTNGIAMQRGIDAGTVTDDELIATLLGTGHLTIDVTSVGEALDTVQTIVGKGDGVTRMAKFYRSTATIREAIDDVDNITVWKEMDVFEWDVNEMKDDDASNVTDVLGELLAVRSTLKDLKSGQIQNKKLAMANLQDSTRRVSKGVEKMIEGLEKYRNLTDSLTDAFTSIHRAARAIVVEQAQKIRMAFSQKDKDDTDDVFKALHQNSTLRNVLPAIKEIGGLLEARENRMFGVEDVKAIGGSLDDPWMRSAIGSGVVELSEALKPLEGIAIALTAAESALTSNPKIPMRLTASRIIEAIEHLPDASADALIATSSHFYTCRVEFGGDALTVMGDHTRIDAKRVVGTLPMLKKRDDAVVQLKAAAAALAEAVAPRNSTADLFERLARKFGSMSALKGVKLNQAVTKAMTANADVQAAFTMLETLPDLETKFRAAYTEAKRTTQGIAFVSDTIHKFQNNLQNYSDYFECLKRHVGRDEARNVADAIPPIVALAEIGGSERVDEVKTIVQRLKATDFGALKAEVASKKTSETSEVLTLFNEVEKHRKTIDAATHGVVKMRTIVETPLEFGREWIKVVQKEKDGTNLTTDVLTMVGDVKKAVDTLNAQLNALDDDVALPESTHVAGLSEMFTEVQKIAGISMDFRELVKLVEQLETTTSSRKRAAPAKNLDLRALRSKLVELQSIGLNFAADYKKAFADAPRALRSIDDAFAALDARQTTRQKPSATVVLKTTTTVSSSSSDSNSNPDGQEDVTASSSDDARSEPLINEEAPGGSGGFPLLVVIIVVVVVLVAAIGTVVWCVVKKRKTGSKESRDSGSGEKSQDSS